MLIGLTAAGLRKIEKAQSNFRVLTFPRILRELRGSADEALGFIHARSGRHSIPAQRIAAKVGAFDDDLQKVAETVIDALSREQAARSGKPGPRGHAPAGDRRARQVGSIRKPAASKARRPRRT